MLLVLTPASRLEAEVKNLGLVGSVAINQDLFWLGEWIERSEVPGGHGRKADCSETPDDKTPKLCFDYFIDVLETGHRLRIAFDRPRLNAPYVNRFGSTARDDFDSYDLAIFGPNCTSDDPTCPEYIRSEVNQENDNSVGTTRASGEVFIPGVQPHTAVAPGRYQVRVFAAEILKNVFRLRARLEPWPEPTTPRIMLPNMRPEPPLELILSGCSTWATLDSEADPGFLLDTTSCIRFIFGWQNAGVGRFEVELVPPAEHPDTVVDGVASDQEIRGRAIQRLYWSDGTSSTRDAGEWEFDPSHGHAHYDGFVNLELFAVDSSSKTIQRVQKAAKLGTCGHEAKMVGWTKFRQQAFIADPLSPLNTREDDAEVAPSNCTSIEFGQTLPDADDPTRIGLAAGWVDFYRRHTPGNEIPFGARPDGEYLVRFTVADPTIPMLAESDYADNVSYAHFRVVTTANPATGLPVRTVQLIERGFGESPWSPASKKCAGPESVCGDARFDALMFDPRLK